MINYAELYHLNQREQQKGFKTDIPFYVLDSNNLCKRDHLIQWMIAKSANLKCNVKTIELAVLYVDIYLNSFNISLNYLELLGISALSLAAKFNQTEFNQQVKLYNSMGQALFDDSEYDEMEVQILQTLKFQSNYVTTSDYLEILKVDINDNMRNLLMFLLIDFEIYQFSHLELALAIIDFQHLDNYKFSAKIQNISNLLYSKIHQAHEEMTVKSEDEPTPIKKKITKRQQQHSLKKRTKITQLQ